MQNNHFLNSFLGGLFIRLFKSDAIWIVRLPNVLIFPVFFWSIVAFRKHFSFRSNYYYFLISLTCIVYVLDFFSLARGYGISWAFLTLALFQSFNFLQKITYRRAVFILLSWLLCISANLSYLTVATFGLGYLILLSIKNKQWGPTIILLSGFLPIYYFVKYAFYLKSIDKLYLGEATNFIATSIHSLSNSVFGNENVNLAIIAIPVFLTLLIILIRFAIKKRTVFQENFLFQIFLCASVLSILVQNYFLGVNFPEGRAAAHLIFFFFGSIAFTMEIIRNKSITKFLIVIPLVFFISQINLSHTREYYYEHFDEELLSKIPLMTKGIPTSTCGRFWEMDNELAKLKKYPARVFQDIRGQKKVFQDYLIQFDNIADERPELSKLYEPVYTDPISKLTLFKRIEFLERKKIYENEVEIEGNHLYFDIIKDYRSVPCFIRCTGKLENASIYDDYSIIFVAEDTLNREKHSYGGLNPSTSTSLNDDGSVSFDFTYTVNDYEDADVIDSYLWNRKNKHLKGKIKVELFLIEL